MGYPCLLQKHIWSVLHQREGVSAWQVGARHQQKKGSNAKTLPRTNEQAGRPWWGHLGVRKGKKNAV